MTPILPATWRDAIAEAVACHPREACGVVLGEGPRQRFQRFDNQADRLHERDPAGFPRDARTAYVIDALKLQRALDAAAAEGDALVAVVHSHPQHPAYLSATDRAAAAPFGAPTFPDALQVVISVYDSVAREVAGFAWDGADWVDVDLTGLPPLPGRPPGAVIREDI